MSGAGGTPEWQVGELPFMWKQLPSPHNPDGLPDVLPFRLGQRTDTGLFVQQPDATVAAALARAYSLGSTITGQMDETGIGRRYADDFLAYFHRAAGRSRYDGARILEIGCGNGYFLHRLHELGAEVIGVEPGDHPSHRYGVPIVRDFFPTPKVSGRFDFVAMFCVIEHLENPAELIRQVIDHLAPGGRLILAVPDCGPYLEAGDISCLFHEHWNYFDAGSLRLTLEQAGGTVLDQAPGGYGGTLYAAVAGERADRPALDPGRPGAPAAGAADTGPAAAFPRYRRLAEASLQAMRMSLESAAASGRSVGIYVPGRVINALRACGAPTGHCRFFDDNPLLKGTYFPGFPIRVEDRGDLLRQPTDEVLIMSRSFGHKIAAELQPLLPAGVRLVSWEGLFGN